MDAALKKTFTAARGSAQVAANCIACAEGWVCWDDKEVDDRDPATMIRDQLDMALTNARIAVTHIERLRELTKQQ